MNPLAQKFHQLLNLIHQNNLRIKDAKLTSRQSTQIFHILNSRRKGYIDLADIYQIYPQATQSELFFIFKYLDISRTSKIQLHHLISAISKQTNENHSIQSFRCDPTDQSIKTLINKFTYFLSILIKNFNSLQKKKASLNITANTLSSLYFQLQKNIKKSSSIDNNQNIISLQIQLICSFLHLQWGFSNNLTTEFKNIFNQNIQFISQKDFLSGFMPFSIFKNYNDIKDENNNTQKKQNNSIYSEISPKKTYNYRFENQKKNLEKNYEIENSIKISSLNNSKTKSFNQYLITRKMNDESLNENKLINLEDIKSKLLIKKNINNDQHLQLDTYQLNNKTEEQKQFYKNGITQNQRRRQQLRKGSLQRKRLMDEVLNRKKQHVNQFTFQQIKNSIPHFNQNIKTNNYLKKSLHQDFKSTQTPQRLQFQRKDMQQYQRLFNKKNQNNYYQKNMLTSSFSQGRLFDLPYDAYQGQINRILSRKNDKYSCLDNSLIKGRYFRESSLQNREIPQFRYDIKDDWKDKYYNNQKSMNEKSYSIQKQNIMRKAEQQATRKIQQIERKARMKVIQKKSSAGFKWKR